MLKRSIFLLCSLAVLMAAVSSCIFDPNPTPPTPPKPVQKEENLTERWHVLNNIEVAYNKRRSDIYSKLLDVDFTFFYTEGDVGGGGVPVQWGRDVEDPATAGLLGDADKVDMDIKWEDGLSWVKVIPASAPAEEWFTTTVFYDFTIDIGETTYVPDAGSKAQFTVRNDGTAETPKWQLVEFRDLGGPNS